MQLVFQICSWQFRYSCTHLKKKKCFHIKLDDRLTCKLYRNYHFPLVIQFWNDFKSLSNYKCSATLRKITSFSMKKQVTVPANIVILLFIKRSICVKLFTWHSILIYRRNMYSHCEILQTKRKSDSSLHGEQEHDRQEPFKSQYVQF